MEKNVKKQSAKEKRQMANMLYGKPQNSNTQKKKMTQIHSINIGEQLYEW